MALHSSSDFCTWVSAPPADAIATPRLASKRSVGLCVSLKTEGRREAALEAALKERAAEAGLAMVVLVTTVESMDAIARLIVRGLHILLTSFEQPQRGLTSTLPRCCSTRNFPTNGLGPTYEAHKFIAHFSTHPIDLRLSSSPARSILQPCDHTRVVG